MWGVKLEVCYDSESILSIWLAKNNINSAKNGPTKLWFIDDIPFNSFVWAVFFAQGFIIIIFNKPLVWHLTCYLKQMYLGVFMLYIIVNGTPTLIGSPWFSTFRFALIERWKFPNYMPWTVWSLNSHKYEAQDLFMGG